MIKVYSREEAWKKADEIFPTDYMKDERSSQNAGYDIFKSTLPGEESWISDLNTSLEVNLASGETVRIVIEKKYEEYQLDDALSIISDAIYEIDDKINHKLAEETGIEDARKTLYAAYAKIYGIIKKQGVGECLIRRYNLHEV